MDRRAFKGRATILGLEHPDTLFNANCLGVTLERQGKYEEAEAMYRQAVEHFGKVLGLQHPNTLISIENFSALLERRGKCEEAEVVRQRVRNLR